MSSSVSKPPKMYKSKQIESNQSGSFLPTIDQSTRMTLNNVSRNISSMEKKIPKNILKELQNEGDEDFFLTTYGINKLAKGMTNQRSNSSGNLSRIKPIVIKKTKQVDVIINDLKGAVNKLKNLKFQKNKTQNIATTDQSDSDDNEGKRKNRKTKIVQEQIIQSTGFNNKYQTLIKQLPDPDLELKDLYHNKTTTNMSRQLYNGQQIYDNRQQQITAMQNTLSEGLQKYNSVLKEIENRNKLLISLKQQINSCGDEIAYIEEQKQLLHGDSATVTKKIEELQDMIEQVSMDRQTLEQMKQTKYKDMVLIKKRCDDTKKIRNDFGKFLFKESESLIQEAKQIDEIRAQFISVQKQKNQTSELLEKAFTDQRIIMQNEQEVVKYIELESAATMELEKLKKEELVERKIREKDEIQEKKKQLFEQQNKMAELDEQFQQIKNRLTGINTVYDILPFFDDITQTNSFCQQKHQNLVQQNQFLRSEITELNNELQDQKSFSLTVHKSNQLQSQMEDSTHELMLYELEQEKHDCGRQKQEEEFLQNIVDKINRALYNQFYTLSHCKIEENEKMYEQNIDRQDIQQRIVKAQRNLVESLKGYNISEEELEKKIENKKLELHKQKADTIQRFSLNDAQDEESSMDFGDSQVEKLK